MSPRALVLLGVLLCGCADAKPYDPTAQVKRRIVVELPSSPEGVRCFSMVTPKGYAFEGLSCFPVPTP